MGFLRARGYAEGDGHAEFIALRTAEARLPRFAVCLEHRAGHAEYHAAQTYRMRGERHVLDRDARVDLRPCIRRVREHEAHARRAAQYVEILGHIGSLRFEQTRGFGSEAVKYFRVLYECEMVGLAVYRAGRLERSACKYVRLLPCESVRPVSADRASFADCFQYFVLHKISPHFDSVIITYPGRLLQARTHRL